MEQMKKFVQQHKRISYALILGFGVLFNCAGFPVYNLSRQWPLDLTIEMIFLLACASVYIGGGLAILFPEKGWKFILGVNIALLCAGMACRFLLEFGEISNTYNFTLPNIALHAAAFLTVSLLAWAGMRRRA